MREPPVVTVVVNNYDYAPFLRAAIDSALAQTWQRTEVVVVDDGSTDDSREVIAGYGDRIRAVLKENGGQGSALNAGFAVATGDLVMLLDADDVLAATAAEAAATAFAEVPQAVVAQFRMRVVDEAGRPTGAVVPPAHVRLPHGDVSDQVRRWSLSSALGPGGAMAFRRDVLERVLPLDAAELRRGPDFYLVRALALLGPVVARDVVLADYRSHGRNDSNVDALDVRYLRTALRRQVAVGRMLTDLALREGRGAPDDPLTAADPVLLSQRLASLRADRAGHLVPTDTRRGLARAGVDAALGRQDVGPIARLVHAAWFVVVATLPRRPAVRIATWLLFPVSRPRLRR